MRTAGACKLQLVHVAPRLNANARPGIWISSNERPVSLEIGGGVAVFVGVNGISHEVRRKWSETALYRYISLLLGEPAGDRVAQAQAVARRSAANSACMRPAVCCGAVCSRPSQAQFAQCRVVAGSCERLAGVNAVLRDFGNAFKCSLGLQAGWVSQLVSMRDVLSTYLPALSTPQAACAIASAVIMSEARPLEIGCPLAIAARSREFDKIEL